MSQADP